ncbi:hypothetical protein YTPLAS18_05650 [Nitrospira sp.]|nr:hypothetical protein YTPLAS18_05650 [Nitrospira sp.]
MKTTIAKFEDLVAWQKASALTNATYKATRSNGFGRDFGLSSQIQRAAASIMSNIAEGFERNRLGEFHQFLSVAKGSCAEVRSHLYVAFDAGYLNERQFNQLLASAIEVGRILGGLRVAVAGQRKQAKPSTNHRLPLTQYSALNAQDSLGT